MIELLAALLVQRPLAILLVGVAHVLAWALLRSRANGRGPCVRVLWVAAVLWLVYAAWEWAVLVLSPEADIRVDLLLIWPVLALATFGALACVAIGCLSARRERH